MYRIYHEQDIPNARCKGLIISITIRKTNSIFNFFKRKYTLREMNNLPKIMRVSS